MMVGHTALWVGSGVHQKAEPGGDWLLGTLTREPVRWEESGSEIQNRGRWIMDRTDTARTASNRSAGRSRGESENRPGTFEQ